MQKRDQESAFAISGRGTLAVAGRDPEPVTFTFRSIDGLVPTSGEIFGQDEDLFYAAWVKGYAQLEFCDISARIKIIGRNSSSGALILEGLSLFRTLARRRVGS